MRAARLITIPIDHVTATFAAFPFATEDALRIGLTALNPDLLSKTDPGTRQLWRSAEQATLGSFPGFSVDEAVAIRDRIWFDKETTQATPLQAVLRRIARTQLEVHGSIARVKVSHQDNGDALTESPTASIAALNRRAWKWLALEMPPDLLLAALGDCHSGPREVETVSPALDQRLSDGGYAETHLHVFAGMDFNSLWTAAMHAVADPNFPREGFGSPGGELQEGRQLAEWLLRALLVRYVLAAYLAWGHQIRDDLRGFLVYEVRDRLVADLSPAAFLQLVQGLSDLRSGKLTATNSFAAWRTLYARITGVLLTPFPDQPNDVCTADPIDRLLSPLGAGRATPEMQYVATALDYLDRKPQDRLFAELFWQTVRVRGLFFRHIVQRPLTPGLTWFVRHSDRIRAPRGAMTDVMLPLRIAANVCGAGRGLRSFEIRTVPADDNIWMTKLVGCTKTLATELQKVNCEVGLILHYCKLRGGGFERGTPLGGGREHEADPGAAQNSMRYRFQALFQRLRGQTNVFVAHLKSQPESLQWIRGVDVCTDELGVPNWVLAPHLQRVREQARVAAGQLCSPLSRRGPLRTTIHAGEDFVHLLTGLRFVDEAMEAFDLREGDRIGHGIALGIDPRVWAQRAGRLAMTREERLFDLIWEWIWHQRAMAEPPTGRRRLDLQIMQLAQDLFREPVSPFELMLLYHDLYDRDQLHQKTGKYPIEDVGFPTGWPPSLSPKSREARLQTFLTDRDVFRRGREIIWIDPAEEGEWLAWLQADLRRKVGSRGLTVEVNPTSNLLIGDFEDLTRHPLWRLRPPRPQAGDAPPVSVCIGSDDPVVFNTDLRQEYQCLADAMKLAGLSEDEALQWLETARRAGLDSRFTL